ncbi:MAG: class I SAM-dependent methyltransferase [Acidimicrobiales bacterium]
MAIANVDMAKAWDGEEGERWAQDADLYDTSSVHLWRAFLATGPIAAGDHVLDIGCGNGKSSRDAARLAAPGEVLGVDLSSAMLDVARLRSAAEGLTNVRFQQADAQVYPFDEGRFDVAISCFGAMFFADPVDAFANIGRALRPGGRLAMLSWRPLADNEWIRALRDALAIGRPLGEPPVSMPGPFGLADPDHVRQALGSAGFEAVAVAPVDQPLVLGADADEAFAFVRRMGIVKGLTQDLDDADRQRALDATYRALEAAADQDGVRFAAAAWLITARR